MFTNIFRVLDDVATHGIHADVSSLYFISWTSALAGIICFIFILLTRYFLSKIEVKNVTNRTVFITGCDCGFGNLLAKALDANGVRVIAGCLTEEGADALRKVSSSCLQTIIVDVTKEESVEKAFQIVKNTLGDEGLWGLVNNAGIMPGYCPAEWATLCSFKKTCDVNLLGTISVTLQFLPLLRMRGGRLVNVCSVTSNFAYPGIADYVVSKTAVKAFSVCLRRELLHSGVTVHTIEPGGYNTSIANMQRLNDAFLQAYKRASSETRGYYGGNIAKYVLWGISWSATFVNYQVHEVTDAMTHALFAKYPDMTYLVGRDAKSFFRLLRLVPGRVADYMVGWPKPYGELIPELKALDLS